MYFPYLRGKQFELLALRELGPLLAENASKISPIIEPVRESPSLLNAFSDLRHYGVSFTVIVNPGVGDLKQRPQDILNKIRSALNNYDNFQLGILVGHDTHFNELLELIKLAGNISSGFTFIHNEVCDQIESFQQSFAAVLPVINNVINSQKTTPRYYRRFPSETRVSLVDYFVSKPRNVEYLDQSDSAFSEEHLYFRDEGFKGFSDYLTIGEKYNEGGYRPYAVAIHLSYPDEQKRIRIKHFVSDSNEDYTDVAGKFAQANSKLVQWCDEHHLDTEAIKRFRSLYENGHFPGLGIIKKLSIMNHIEMVLRLI